MPSSKLLIRLIAAVTPDCDVVTRLISESRERTLTSLERMRLRWHYRICQWCRRYQDHLEEIAAVSKRVSSPQAEQRDRGRSDERKARLRKLLE